jgi:hypothetical protein
MTGYPEPLGPDSLEVLLLPSGDEVHIPKARPAFKAWSGEFDGDTYGNKPLVDVDGEPMFAELAILKLFQKDGWDGVWVDTFSRKYRTAWGEGGVVRLSGERLELLKTIHQRAGSASGCFDVYCWREDFVLFAESKRASKDHIRDTQLRWLEAALRIGLDPSSLLVVEWFFSGSFATHGSAHTQTTRRVELSQGSVAGRAEIARSSDAEPEDKASPSPSYDSLEVFFDAYDEDAHDMFLMWRERNWGGYVVSRRSPGDGMLHQADCGHFEHGDKSASLTRTMKACSRNKGELESWARENMSRGLKRCRSCM